MSESLDVWTAVFKHKDTGVEFVFIGDKVANATSGQAVFKEVRLLTPETDTGFLLAELNGMKIGLLTGPEFDKARENTDALRNAFGPLDSP